MSTASIATTQTIQLLNDLGGQPMPAFNHPNQLKVALANQGASQTQLWQVDVVLRPGR